MPILAACIILALINAICTATCAMLFVIASGALESGKPTTMLVGAGCAVLMLVGIHFATIPVMVGMQYGAVYAILPALGMIAGPLALLRWLNHNPLWGGA